MDARVSNGGNRVLRGRLVPWLLRRGHTGPGPGPHPVPARAHHGGVVRDVLAYLIAALGRGPSGIVDVGGNRVTYRQMVLQSARVRGLRRLIPLSAAPSSPVTRFL